MSAIQQPPAQWAQDITLGDHIIFCAGDFYKYESGCYRKWHEKQVFKSIQDRVGFSYSPNKIKDIITCLQADCFKQPDEITNHIYLNLSNGLLDLTTFELLPHTHKVISTIQLKVKYTPEAACPLWIKSLDEIFEGDQKKIGLLQEFFGLCLTTDTKYEKALFLIGEGANGKSVILYVFQQMIGEDNYAAIPLEKFNSGPYLANLFNTLVNISIETNARSSVYDANFKAIVSGDVIPADAKFKPPFKFRPYCKLIFALNSMPHVDDKTSAFFRRLLILRFPRIFEETERNRNLKFELLAELDGIFNWSLQGLKRLRELGDFEMTEEMRTEVDEYKKDNNNVILFVEDKCELRPEYTETKEVLHSFYSQWCRDNNCHPLAKRKFGKELKKQYPQIDGEGRNSTERLWQGIKFIKLL